MCKQCEQNPVYEFTNKRKLCKSCFIKYFDKKVLYINRKFDLIKPGEVIAYKKSNDVKDVVLEDILKIFTNRGMIKVVKLPFKDATKVAISFNVDIESHAIINTIINGNSSKLHDSFPKIGKIIKPLYLFTDKEILLYAKIKGLKFKEKKIKKDKITDFIDDLEIKHPEVKRAIVNSLLEIEEINLNSKN